jgi:Tol biopolymer transport system component
MSGLRLGAYEFTDPIGAGGMGEVYRGRDLRLNRQVALKVLPATLAQDADRLARFKREAQVLASLNHPNIAAIYGFEEDDRIQAIVLELVEGPTLAERLQQGALPTDEALSIARQIADALEGAHEQGIIHRDLKPANVKVRPDGTVKVLDFGLAKALDPPVGAASDVTASPTITSPAMTRAGLILGTAAYMSPEQAKGRAADRRSDVWAYGALLYEMLTGQRAFDGEDVADTLAFVLTKEPDWSVLPPATPAGIRTLLRRCLEKDRKRRLADIADARLEIDDLTRTARDERPGGTASVAAAVPSVVKPPSLVRRAGAAGIVLALAAVAAYGGWRAGRAAPAPEAVQFVVLPPDGERFALITRFLSVSPDGRLLAYLTGTVPSEHRLWIRPLRSLEVTEIRGAGFARNPIWSPDSRAIAFISATGSGATGRLRRVNLAGGSAMTLADAWGGGLAWSPSGVIIFTGADGRLYRVADTGGEATALSELLADQQETRHVPGFFLKDGRRFAFRATNTAGTKSTWYLASLDSPLRTPLLEATSTLAYAGGQLLFDRDGTLMSQPFEETQGRLTGAATPLLEGLDRDLQRGEAAFSVSEGGVLAYRRAEEMADTRLTWHDLKGRALSALTLDGLFAPFRAPTLSPDGRRLAVTRGEGLGKHDIWLLDLERNVPSRFTFDGSASRPVWTPDGMRIIYSANRKGVADLYQLDSRSGGPGSGELLFESAVDKNVQAVSPDGRVLLFGQAPQGNPEIWALPLTGERMPIPIVRTGFPAGNADFSPDGKWFAYCEGDSGADQVYVQPYPPNGTRIRISPAGGSSPQWSHDGRTIVYVSTSARLESVRVSPEAGSLRVEGAIDLFAATSTFLHRAVLFDSKASRVLLPTLKGSSGPQPITVVLNWSEEFQQRSGSVSGDSR